MGLHAGDIVAVEQPVQLPNGVVIAFGGAVDAKSLALVLSTAASLS